MKRQILRITLLLCITVLFSSCYVNTFSVGKGAQTGIKYKQKNHYLLGGLIPLGNADPKTMVSGAADYDVKIKFTFVDYLIAGITGGIYTPTTTIVKK